MHAAFHTFHYSPMVGADADQFSVIDVIDAAAAVGFDRIGVDLTSIEAHLHRGGAMSDVHDALDRGGFSLTDVLHHPITDDAEANEQSLGRIGALLDRFDVPWCLAAVPSPMNDGALVAATIAAADRVSEFGAQLAIEFCSHLHLATLADAIALGDAVGWHRCGLVLDSLHFFRAGADWDSLAGLKAAQIAFVQLSDATAHPVVALNDESRNRRMIPGEGALALDEFLDAVRATGFDGDVVAEVLSTELRALPMIVGVGRVHDAMTAMPALR